LLSWNVRGLNNLAMQEGLRQLINFYKPDLICIQETKQMDFTARTNRRCLGSMYEAIFAFLPADGTRRGGVLIAARVISIHLLNPATTNHTISVHVKDDRFNTTWMLIGVYGPQGDLEKKCLLRSLKPSSPLLCTNVRTLCIKPSRQE
jgi:exonuclease III